jgi:hypothetical protein
LTTFRYSGREAEAGRRAVLGAGMGKPPRPELSPVAKQQQQTGIGAHPESGSFRAFQSEGYFDLVVSLERDQKNWVTHRKEKA